MRTSRSKRHLTSTLSHNALIPHVSSVDTDKQDNFQNEKRRQEKKPQRILQWWRLCKVRKPTFLEAPSPDKTHDCKTLLWTAWRIQQGQSPGRDSTQPQFIQFHLFKEQEEKRRAEVKIRELDSECQNIEGETKVKIAQEDQRGAVD